MSASWCQFAGPADAKAGARQPHRVGIVSLNVRRLRQLSLSVEHTPDRPNGAYVSEHAEVFGPKTIEVRTLLADAALIAIAPEPEQVADSVAKKMSSKKS